MLKLLKINLNIFMWSILAGCSWRPADKSRAARPLLGHHTGRAAAPAVPEHGGSGWWNGRLTKPSNATQLKPRNQNPVARGLISGAQSPSSPQDGAACPPGGAAPLQAPRWLWAGLGEEGAPSCISFHSIDYYRLFIWACQRVQCSGTL